MMTPQDIREKTFEKAVFGGYDMGAVDDFLEEASNDYADIHKENAILKSKIKVLVEKVEEYRATEDAMRLALLSAQKMGVQIEGEAKAKSDSLLTSARTEAERLVREAEHEVATEEARLVEAKSSSAQFIENMRLLCSRQLDFLDSLGEFKLQSAPAAEPAGPEPEKQLADTVRSIEDSVAKASTEPEPEIDIHSGEAADFDDSDDPTRLYSFGRELDADAPTSKFSLDNLRFGGNYTK